jgi:hypothetical protein
MMVSNATSRKTAGLRALRESPMNRAEEIQTLLLLYFSKTITRLSSSKILGSLFSSLHFLLLFALFASSSKRSQRL